MSEAFGEKIKYANIQIKQKNERDYYVLLYVGKIKHEWKWIYCNLMNYAFQKFHKSDYSAASLFPSGMCCNRMARDWTEINSIMMGDYETFSCPLKREEYYDGACSKLE